MVVAAADCVGGGDGHLYVAVVFVVDVVNILPGTIEKVSSLTGIA